MKLHLIPLYEDIFEGPRPIRAELLKTIPTDALIRFCSFINARLDGADNPLDREIEIFLRILSRFSDPQKRDQCQSKLEAFLERATRGTTVHIFPLVHTLSLIQNSLLNYVPGIMKSLSEEAEINILRLLLIQNSEANDSFKGKLEQMSEAGSGERLYQLMWTSLLSTSPFMVEKNILLALYKSIKFLKFLEHTYPKQLATFLNINGLTAPILFPLQLFELYQNGMKMQNEGKWSCFLGGLPQNKIVTLFTTKVDKIKRTEWEELGLNINLKGLRTRPLIEFTNGDVGVTNWNFVIEKFYDGLVFDFYYHSGINTEPGFRELRDYKSRLGQEFSDPFFIETMKAIFTPAAHVLYGDKERNIDCTYDFYIRINNHVFLFEFKDILLPIKETYEEIKKTVDNKLLGESGVKQLVRFIEKYSEIPDHFDELRTDNLKDLTIHPIIVYTDNSFGMPGIGNYVDQAFEAELKDEVRAKFLKVAPITLIPFDFFLENHDEFLKGKMHLADVMMQYYQCKIGLIQIQVSNPNPQSLMATYLGFNSIINELYPYHPNKYHQGTITEYVLKEFAPYLPKSEDKPKAE